MRCRRFLCAASLACYGMLALLASGPHSHDLTGAATGRPAAATGPGWAAPREVGDPGQGRSQLARCSLCTWNRSTSRMVMAVSATVHAPSVTARWSATPTCRAGSAVPRNVLLRAPPAA